MKLNTERVKGGRTMDDRVDIWREDGDTGSWMVQRTVSAMGDISAETVAREVCRVQGYGDAYLAPVSERSQTKEYLDE